MTLSCPARTITTTIHIVSRELFRPPRSTTTEADFLYRTSSNVCVAVLPTLMCALLLLFAHQRRHTVPADSDRDRRNFDNGGPLMMGNTW